MYIYMYVELSLVSCRPTGPQRQRAQPVRARQRELVPQLQQGSHRQALVAAQLRRRLGPVTPHLLARLITCTVSVHFNSNCKYYVQNIICGLALIFFCVAVHCSLYCWQYRLPVDVHEPPEVCVQRVFPRVTSAHRVLRQLGTRKCGSLCSTTVTSLHHVFGCQLRLYLYMYTYTQSLRKITVMHDVSNYRALLVCSPAYTCFIISCQVWDPFVGMGVRTYESARNSNVTVLNALPGPHTSLVTVTTDSVIKLLDVRQRGSSCEFKAATAPLGNSVTSSSNR